MSSRHAIRTLAALLCVSWLFASGAATATTLAVITNTGVVKLGFREDAAPFSYRDSRGGASGYMVDLCHHVVAQLKADLQRSDLAIEYVAVNARDRFDAVASGRIHLLCGPTTVTLNRREQIDFSLFTFVDGASVIFREDGPRNLEALAGHRIGVRAGTTTQAALDRTLTAANLRATLTPVRDHNDGIKGVMRGELSAYFADRSILARLMENHENPASLRLSKRFFTFEPYALGLRRGDSELRLLVDRALANLFRSGRIERILFNHFSRRVQPTELLSNLYLLNGLAAR